MTYVPESHFFFAVSGVRCQLTASRSRQFNRTTNFILVGDHSIL